jgi:hypothetical protein
MEAKNLRLFVISLVMLFLEILLIRWISTEVRIFAYVSNLVLLACFLGIGVGCYFAGRKENLLITFGALSLIALAVRSEPFRQITELLSGFSDAMIWYQIIGTLQFSLTLQGVFLTLLMFAMIVAAFIPLGQILGRCLDEHPRIIEGYSVNIVASLIGIWIFNIFSLYYTEPRLWFAFSLVILLFFVPRSVFGFALAGSAAALILLVVGFAPPRLISLWSPYQKLEVRPNFSQGIRNGYVVNVNNVGYMTLLDLSDHFIKNYPGPCDPKLRAFSQYDLPYAFAEKNPRVLIVGAGGGNDVAGALRHQPREIEAVEIDPGIVQLGLALHPEGPYENKKVRLTIDDARAFFKKTPGTYDLISFGLLDSHTLSSNYNNTRLDHYVYTEESFREARALLSRDGIISVIFAVQAPWIGERIYGLLKKVFGEVPYVFAVRSSDSCFGWGGTMFITGKNITALKQRVASNPELLDWLGRNRVAFSGRVKLTTDDWPYLYIKEAKIPRMFLLIMGVLLVLFLLAGRFVLTTGGGRVNWHFFFLGCAFLLLEFQNVSKATLLFGSTWAVNAYIISTILVLILLANLFVAVFRVQQRLPFYLLLWASIVTLYLVPLEAFNAFGFWAKTLLASTFLNLPIFFAGIIFILSFRDAQAKDRALGSNLIGAALGGLLESLSFMTGIKALILLVLVLYFLSFLFLGRKKSVAVPKAKNF